MYSNIFPILFETYNLTVYEFQFLSIIFSACCYKIKVSCFTCNKGAHVAQKHIYGYYYSQSGTVGGRQHYKSSDGQRAIWYNEGLWLIGRIEDLGSHWGWANVKTSEKCPYDPAYTWKFWNGGLSTWYDLTKLCPYGANHNT